MASQRQWQIAVLYKPQNIYSPLLSTSSSPESEGPTFWDVQEFTRGFNMRLRMPPIHSYSIPFPFDGIFAEKGEAGRLEVFQIH
ncbi:MAG: hypothetical protein Q9172_007734, partial [Xanthocarpia lactea]